MNLCNKDHDEVCFEGRQCPLCEAIKQYKLEQKEAANEIEDLRQQVSELERQLEEPMIPAMIQAQNQAQ